MTKNPSTDDRLAAVTRRYDTGDGEAGQLLQQAQERLAWRLRHSGKRCSKCGADRPLSAFTRDRQRADGLSPWCRDCHSARRLVRQDGMPSNPQQHI